MSTSRAIIASTIAIGLPVMLVDPSLASAAEARDAAHAAEPVVVTGAAAEIGPWQTVTIAQSGCVTRAVRVWTGIGYSFRAMRRCF
jgi:hypothetical protein